MYVSATLIQSVQQHRCATWESVPIDQDLFKRCQFKSSVDGENIFF